MGFSWTDIRDSLSSPMAIFSPAQAMYSSGGGWGLDSGLGRFTSFVGDPMDLYGERADFTQQQKDAIAKSTADQAIAALGEQYAITGGLQKPFLDLGATGLGQMGQYSKGQNFDTMLNEGARQLRGSANASGLGNSSAAGRNLSGFVNNLTQEDMDRQYQQNLRNIQIGQNAVGTMGQAASGLGSDVSGIYGNWGQQSMQNALGYGQQRQDSFNNASQALSGAASYYGSK